MTPQRVTMITLGVADLERSKRFYQDIGWTAHPRSQDSIVFFQMHGSLLGLYEINALAEDQHQDRAKLGTGAISLAQNHATKEEVDAAFAKAIAAGAHAQKQPQEVFWGGYSGYFADPDGHMWEIAMNPFWPLNEDGSLTLPEA